MNRLFTISSIILLIVISSVLLQAQKRYVVNSDGDSYLINKGESARSVIEKQTHKKIMPNKTLTGCVASQPFGILPWEHLHRPLTAFLHTHKDLSAMWFETPASGRIDSVYIQMGPDSAAEYPGKLTMRIHHSNIYTGHAPGWAPYMAPPKLCWGYFNNTGDADQGLAAFKEDATDQNWHSTYNRNNWGLNPEDHFGELVDTTLATFPPAAEEISSAGGVDVYIHPNAITGVDLTWDSGIPVLPAGYPLFISFTVDADHPANMGTNPPYTDPTLISVLGNDDRYTGPCGCDPDPTAAARRIFHNWKFFEHGTYCGPGWVARGDDQLYIWYVMSRTDDPPPTIQSVDVLGHTTMTTGSRDVTAELLDCNFTPPPNNAAGIATADLIYNINNGSDVVVSMTPVGGTTYRASIPNIACGGTTRYHLEVTDVNSNISHSQEVTYRTLCLRENIYLADTGAARSFTGSLAHSIGRHAVSDSLFNDPAATVIDTSRWFTFNRNPQLNKRDDGTAGPFSIGNFIFCDDTMHYAWVGVNGGFALSKAATDTVNVNSNGEYADWALPSSVHKALPDTATYGSVPRNFIGVMWADFIAGDTLNKWGNVYYRDEPSKFIVEWDSLAVFNAGNATRDAAIFRCILHKDDRTIEFQYDAVGTNGADSACVVGIQSDSTNPNMRHGFILLNNFAAPIETKPRNNWAIRFYPINSLAVAAGWNMLSVTTIPPPTGNYSKSYLFPSATSDAFYYNAGYKTTALLTNGPGYWMKFAGAGSEGVPGTPDTCVDITLVPGWNMIGSGSMPIATLGLACHPPGSGFIRTAFYGYNGGYAAADFLVPGYAYWIAINDTCTLTLCSSFSAPKPLAIKDDLTKMNTLTLHGTNGSAKLYLGEETYVKSAGFYELPPPPPAGIFDARFASQQQVETYPAVIDKGKNYQYAITIQSSIYPVTVEWNIVKQPEGRQLILTDGINSSILGNNILDGTGSIRITNASVKTLIIKLGEGVLLPKEFSLSRNYPNPFNPVTNLSVAIPKTADVNVSVYDILGRNIATLMSGSQSAGYHTIQWDGKNSHGLDVPSGAYFIRMMSGSYQKAQKVLLMK
ncbi:MAG: FlgD immunoglobulin-like domain containing protein [Bacteroidota bacterium]